MQEILIEINMFVSSVVINPLAAIQTQGTKHWGRDVSVSVSAAKTNLQRLKKTLKGATRQHKSQTDRE